MSNRVKGLVATFRLTSCINFLLMEFITDGSLCEAQLLIWLPHCLLGKCAQVCKSWSRRGAARARQMISRSRMKLDPSESIWKHLQAGQRVTMMVIFVRVTHVFTSLIQVYVGVRECVMGLLCARDGLFQGHA